MAVSTLETDYPFETDNPSSKLVKIDGKQVDKVRRIVHLKFRPFYFQIKTYYLSEAIYLTDNSSQTDNPSLVWIRPINGQREFRAGLETNRESNTRTTRLRFLPKVRWELRWGNDGIFSTSNIWAKDMRAMNKMVKLQTPTNLRSISKARGFAEFCARMEHLRTYRKGNASNFLTFYLFAPLFL